MIYCTSCVLPSTRPKVRIGADGICSACTAHRAKMQIAWAQRERQFRTIVEKAKARCSSYDCLIPVSGGKDSIWQVVTCLSYGLRPLAVTCKPALRTELGRRNLENLIRLGVDHIDYQLNLLVEQKLCSEAFLRYGAPGIPMHLALFGVPRRLAAQQGIPLIVWGENAALEYGGVEEQSTHQTMNGVWLKAYGATQGTTATEWMKGVVTEKELQAYCAPTDAALASQEITSLFLGDYVFWDPTVTLAVARAHGFAVQPPSGRSGERYTDLDDPVMQVDQYLKWYKFGLTKSFEELSIDIRHGRLRREEAIHILRERGEERPQQAIDLFCEFLGITVARFFEVAECFRNPAIWTQRDGVWMIPEFLISNWGWDREDLSAPLTSHPVQRLNKEGVS